MMTNDIALNAGKFASRISLPTRILNKSLDLFRRRRIIEFAQLCLAPEAFQAWLTDALVVQKKIYELDYHYEQSIRLLPEDEAPLWENAEAVIDLSNEFVVSGFADLHAYGRLESRIHVFDRIYTDEYSSIVNLKCADVRMARGLIYAFGALPPSAKVLQFWRLYDQCWELIEDMQDIGEDGSDWNFNFWLYPYMSGGDLITGLCDTRKILDRKLDELHSAFLTLPYPEFVRSVGIFQNTLAANLLLRRRQERFYKALMQHNIVTFSELSERG